MHFNGQHEISMEEAPTSRDLLELYTIGSRIALDEVAAHPSGLRLDLRGAVVDPPADDDARFDVMPSDVEAELLDYLRADGRAADDAAEYPYRLISRRMRDLFNSTGMQLSAIRRRTPHNPAFLHSSDLAALGVEPGDELEIQSEHSAIRAIVGVDDDLRPGVLSIAHGWGAADGEDEDASLHGSCVNRLVDADKHFEQITAMPHFSAVPVRITAVTRADGTQSGGSR